MFSPSNESELNMFDESLQMMDHMHTSPDEAHRTVTSSMVEMPLDASSQKIHEALEMSTEDDIRSYLKPFLRPDGKNYFFPLEMFDEQAFEDPDPVELIEKAGRFGLHGYSRF